MLRASLAPSVLVLIAGIVAATAADFSHQPAAAPTLTVDGEAAMVTIAVRPDRAADFERILDRTKAALLRSANAQRKAQAAGWQVFKSEEMVQGNATYVMRLDPAVQGAEYGFAALIAEGSPSEGADVSRQLRDIVIGQSVLSLRSMAVAGLGGPSPKIDGASRPAEARSPVLSFDTAQAAVITVLIRPDREADFIATLDYLGKALQTSRGAARQRQASGWKVMRGTEAFGANTVFVMSLDPLVPRVEYDLIRLIQETFPADIDAIFGRYRAAYVGQAVSRLTARFDMAK